MHYGRFNSVVCNAARFERIKAWLLDEDKCPTQWDPLVRLRRQHQGALAQALGLLVLAAYTACDGHMLHRFLHVRLARNMVFAAVWSFVLAWCNKCPAQGA